MARLVVILLLLSLIQCGDKKQPGHQPKENVATTDVSDGGLKYGAESLKASLTHSVIRVSFERTSNSDPCNESCVVVTKTIGGAFAEHFRCGNIQEIKLEMNDRAGFIEALYACRIYEWTRQNIWINEDGSLNKNIFFESFPVDYAPLILNISFSDRNDFEFEYWGKENPQGWMELRGIMNDMELRIKNGQKR